LLTHFLLNPSRGLERLVQWQCGAMCYR